MRSAKKANDLMLAVAYNSEGRIALPPMGFRVLAAAARHIQDAEYADETGRTFKSDRRPSTVAALVAAGVL